MDIKKEREAFEKLPEIKKRLDMKCVHFNGTWYATNPHMGASFATAQYLNGAWYAWQAAKAQAVPEGFVLVPKLLSDELADELAGDAFNNIQSLLDYEHRGSTAIEREEFRLKWCRIKAKEYQHHYKTLIKAQEPAND